jgi:dihydroxyacetone kinase-like protein
LYIVITKNQIVQWLQTVACVLEQNKEYLTQLDAAIGDADHGINMTRGFQKVLSQLPTVMEKNIGDILKSTGMALLSSVGGASGPLYGTFFMRAGTAIGTKPELSTADIVTLLQAAIAGVRERGKVQIGDKTMMDALVPGVDTLQKTLAEGRTTIEALQQAVAAAEKGMKDTIPLLAKKGRASYLGERSIGHQDPGATSAYLLLKALLDVVTDTSEP